MSHSTNAGLREGWCKVGSYRKDSCPSFHVAISRRKKRQAAPASFERAATFTQSTLGPSSFQSRAFGVGQKEDARAEVRGANVTRTNDGPRASVAVSLKMGADGGHNASCA